jgi:CheY-like chemotaxis protein
MIYLFDDKKNRQEDYRWTNEKFILYVDSIKPIYHYNEVKEEVVRSKIFSEGNIILFHESFFDTDFNRHHKEAIEIRRKLEEFAQATPNFSLAFFSGSKSIRMLNQNVAYLPVSILYQNLEEFIQQAKKGVVDLKYLLYGKKPNIEQDLVEKLRDVNANLLKHDKPFIKPEGTKILIATTITSDRLPQIVSGAKYNMNLSGDSDLDIHKLIITNLQNEQYDKIFIPLCFGESLSDFNGLRLAAHIRCTDTINQNTAIFIYSFVKIDELINHEYFNILKTKNLQLVDYTVKAFEDVINLNPEIFELNELSYEIAKLKLEVPKNYEDSHSFANEWAIYRWAKAIDADDNAIESIIEKVNTQLYFKYLRTIYPISEIPQISQNELKIKNPGQPKILFVDDDAEKGWYEILCKILSDINSIGQVYYLGDDLKKVSQEKIIDKTLYKVLEDDIDIVILDFRLHPDDFVTTNINDITGFKLLQSIKKINPGIQVIIFSATTKISNLQVLQEAGADGFIVKESPEKTSGMSTTYSIKDFIKTFESCNNLNFLKEFYKCDFEVEKELTPRRKITNEKPLPKQFVDETLKWLRLSNNILSKGNLNETKMISSFLFKFSVLENLANRIIDVDNPILIGKNEKGINKYKFRFRISDKRLRNYIEDENNVGYYRKTNKVYESSRNLPWIIKILNAIDFITEEKLSEEELTMTVKKRNDFIHVNSTTGSKIEITIDDLIFLNKIIIAGLKHIV